jgi:uncharacterized lipoprotein YddW (UPF0748 family)
MKFKLVCWLGLTLILGAICGCLYGTTQLHPAVQNQETRGIWIRLPNDEPELDRILDDLSRAKFNAAFIETFYHGYTIYPSSVFPERPELNKKDLLKLFIDKAHRRNIQVHCWIEVLYWRPTPDTNFPQTPILAEHPEWLDLDINGKTTEGFESKHYLVNPAVPEVQQQITGLVNELCTKYQIDGINLDYIRYAAGNTEFGYNAYALDKFKRLYHFDPKTIDPKKDQDKWRQWSQFREQQVTELVALISQTVKQSKKPVKLSAAVFPEYYQNRYTDSRLQDWSTWCNQSYLDFLTPMCYSSSLEGIKKEISISQSSAGKVPVYPGLAVLAGSNHPELAKQIQVSRDMGCKGEIVFCYSWMTTFPKIFQELGEGIYSK